MEKMSILEINREPEAIGPSIRELMPAFKKTLEHGKCLLINFTQGAVGMGLFERELELICDTLPNKGLSIYVMAEDAEDGARRMGVLQEVLAKRGSPTS